MLLKSMERVFEELEDFWLVSIDICSTYSLLKLITHVPDYELMQFHKLNKILILIK